MEIKEIGHIEKLLSTLFALREITLRTKNDNDLLYFLVKKD